MKNRLWVTNTGVGIRESVLLSTYEPVLGLDGTYRSPLNTSLDCDLWIPNYLEIKPEEGSVRVDIVKTEEETGLRLICVEGKKFLYVDSPSYHFYFRVDTNIKVQSGSKPINVRLRRRKSNKRRNGSTQKRMDLG